MEKRKEGTYLFLPCGKTKGGNVSVSSLWKNERRERICFFPVEKRKEGAYLFLPCGKTKGGSVSVSSLRKNERRERSCFFPDVFTRGVGTATRPQAKKATI